MNKNFSYYLSKYLKEYLVVERNLSKETIRSYTKTFGLLIDYLVSNKHIQLKDITFENVTRDMILDFLNHLEEKGNCIRTRNQRLAGIKSFYQYCLYYEIQNIDNINKILTIKFKKCAKPIQDYLTEEELESIFASIDTSTNKGKRDLLILVLLYDTGARSCELINLKISDINLETKIIKLIGKGNKERYVPIMEKTKKLLAKYININSDKNTLFEIKSYQLIRYLFKKINIIKGKKITPHTFRRTRAIHLLDKGVNVVYIQELLGHVNILTTQDYTRAITKSKFEAIEKVTPTINADLTDWNDDQDLLNQLLNL